MMAFRFPFLHSSTDEEIQETLQSWKLSEQELLHASQGIVYPSACAWCGESDASGICSEHKSSLLGSWKRK